MAAIPKIELTIARRSQPPRRTSTRKARSRPRRLGQIARQNEPVVTSKCASGRPLLTESAPQVEFVLTRSKQTTEKFLTEARTHIRIFDFSPFATQNLGQLIQRLPIHLRGTNPKTRPRLTCTFPAVSPARAFPSTYGPVPWHRYSTSYARMHTAMNHTPVKITEGI